jgi:hypothetical protein
MVSKAESRTLPVDTTLTLSMAVSRPTRSDYGSHKFLVPMLTLLIAAFSKLEFVNNTLPVI